MHLPFAVRFNRGHYIFINLNNTDHTNTDHTYVMSTQVLEFLTQA